MYVCMPIHVCGNSNTDTRNNFIDLWKPSVQNCGFHDLPEVSPGLLREKVSTK